MRDNRKRDQRAALMFAGIFTWICRERNSEMNNWRVVWSIKRSEEEILPPNESDGC